MSTLSASLKFSDDAFVTDKPPLFDKNDVVYLRSEYVNATNDSFDYNPYKVVDVKYQSDGTDVTSSDGVTPADSGVVPNLSTTDEDITDDTNLLYATFYILQNVATNKLSTVHESDLKTLAGVKLRIAAASATWTDPA